MRKLIGKFLKPAAVIALLLCTVPVFGENENDPKDSADIPKSHAAIGFHGLAKLIKEMSPEKVSAWADILTLRKGAHFTSAQKKLFLENFLKNVDDKGNESYSGAVWASPSEGRLPGTNGPHDEGEADYRFNWVRDSAIAHGVLVDLMSQPDTKPSEREEFMNALHGYVDFNKKLQQLEISHEWIIHEPNGNVKFVPKDTPGAIPSRFGEAKYRVEKLTTGPNSYVWVPKDFEKEWGRPQNDGPALRASALAQIINLILDKRDRGEKLSPREEQTLATSFEVMKNDAEYTEARWRDRSYDVWEEILGVHFFTRVAQSEGLRDAALAIKRTKLPGSRQEAARLLQEHRQVEKSLERFMHKPDPNDPSTWHLVTTVDPAEGGMRKDTNIDSAILLGALRKKSGRFTVRDDWVIATTMRLYHGFKAEETAALGEDSGLPSVAMKRYFRDPWTGERRVMNPDGSPASAGHAWIITSYALGQFFAEVGNQFQQRGKFEVNAMNRSLFDLLFDHKLPTRWQEPLAQGKAIRVTSSEHAEEFQQVLLRLADHKNLVFARLFLSGITLSHPQSEQFSGYVTDREGKENYERKIGVTGLTWNCAAFFQLLGAARNLKATIRTFSPSGRK